METLLLLGTALGIIICIILTYYLAFITFYDCSYKNFSFVALIIITIICYFITHFCYVKFISLA